MAAMRWMFLLTKLPTALGHLGSTLRLGPVELEAGQLFIFVYKLYRKLTSTKASYSSSLLTWLTPVVPTRVVLTARRSMQHIIALVRGIYARDTTSTGSMSGQLHICERLGRLMRWER